MTGGSLATTDAIFTKFDTTIYIMAKGAATAPIELGDLTSQCSFPLRSTFTWNAVYGRLAHQYQYQ